MKKKFIISILYAIIISISYISIFIFLRDRLDNTQKYYLSLIYVFLLFILPTIFEIYFFIKTKQFYSIYFIVTLIGCLGFYFASALYWNNYTNSLRFYHGYSFINIILFFVITPLYVLLLNLIYKRAPKNIHMALIVLLDILWLLIIYILLFLSIFQSPA